MFSFFNRKRRGATMGNSPSSDNNDDDGDRNRAGGTIAGQGNHNDIDGDDGGGREAGRHGPQRPGSLMASMGLSHRIVGGGSNHNGIGGGSVLSSVGSSIAPHFNLPSSLSLPFRSGGSLGLSRSELDERCNPSG